MKKLFWFTLPALLVCQASVAQEDEGYGFSLDYTSEVWKVEKGGLDDDLVYLDNLDFSFERNIGSGTFFAYALYNNGNTLSETHVGDSQTISNIDNSKMVRLYEVWYDLPLVDGKGSLKVGLLDLNAEFDAIDTAGLFINSSHGIGPDFSQTGENGPSIYPNTSLAVRYIHTEEDNFDIRVGIFDAVPNDPDRPKHHKFSLNEGALLAAEVNKYFHNGLRFGVGVWNYTDKFPRLEDPLQEEGGNWGGYFMLEGQLNDSINGWARYGLVNKDSINEVSNYFGAGLVHNNFLGRENDQLGFALARANPGKSVPEGVSETNLELTWRLQVNDWLALQPNFQYVLHPGYDPLVEDAFVIGLRLEVGVTF